MESKTVQVENLLEFTCSTRNPVQETPRLSVDTLRYHAENLTVAGFKRKSNLVHLIIAKTAILMNICSM
jgi:predicted transcriptional regulator